MESWTLPCPPSFSWMHVHVCSRLCVGVPCLPSRLHKQRKPRILRQDFVPLCIWPRHSGATLAWLGGCLPLLPNTLLVTVKQGLISAAPAHSYWPGKPADMDATGATHKLETSMPSCRKESVHEGMLQQWVAEWCWIFSGVIPTRGFSESATFTNDGERFSLLRESPTHSYEHFGTECFVDKGDRRKCSFQSNHRLIHTHIVHWGGIPLCFLFNTKFGCCTCSDHNCLYVICSSDECKATISAVIGTTMLSVCRRVKLFHISLCGKLFAPMEQVVPLFQRMHISDLFWMKQARVKVWDC